MSGIESQGVPSIFLIFPRQRPKRFRWRSSRAIETVERQTRAFSNLNDERFDSFFCRRFFFAFFYFSEWVGKHPHCVRAFSYETRRKEYINKWTYIVVFFSNIFRRYIVLPFSVLQFLSLSFSSITNMFIL